MTRYLREVELSPKVPYLTNVLRIRIALSDKNLEAYSNS